MPDNLVKATLQDVKKNQQLREAFIVFCGKADKTKKLVNAYLVWSKQPKLADLYEDHLKDKARMPVDQGNVLKNLKKMANTMHARMDADIKAGKKKEADRFKDRKWRDIEQSARKACEHLVERAWKAFRSSKDWDKLIELRQNQKNNKPGNGKPIAGKQPIDHGVKSVATPTGKAKKVRGGAKPIVGKEPIDYGAGKPEAKPTGKARKVRGGVKPEVKGSIDYV